MKRLKRWALRTLGVSYAAQDILLDPRRWSVTVSAHVIQQAGERYRQGDPKFITLDVVEALCYSRTGDRTPSNRHGAKKFCFLAWTADEHRVYVVKRQRRNILVVTALPTAWSVAEAEKRSLKGAARPVLRGKTAMRQAFERAGIQQ